MNKLTHGATRLLVLAFGLGLALTGWAADIVKTNPVTGETGTYSYTYVGSGNWTAADWQDANEAPADAAPNTSGSNIWTPLLVDGKTVSVGTIEGYTFRLGLFGGANATIGTLTKFQSGCWIQVDSTSVLTVNALGDGSYEGVNRFYVAASQGIKFTMADYNKGGTYWYHFTGDGSVSYKQLTGGTHSIKDADVTLEQPSAKVLRNKTLVSFTNQPTIGIDAAVKIKNASGDVLHVAYLNSCADTEPTISTADSAGTCQFVRTSTGIVLYWVDGEFSAPSSYGESISVNFEHGSTGVDYTYGSAYGAPGYSVQGAYWNTMVSAGGSSGSFSTPLSSVVRKSSNGSREVAEGLSVAVSNTRGSWYSSGGNILYGYIDDTNNGTQNPVVTVANIPADFANYRVVMYFSNDTNGRQFGYVTLNDQNYWGTGAWGSANYAAFVEDGNYRVSPVIPRGDGTLTIVTHNMQSNVRAGLAAVQIVKVDAGYIASDGGTGELAWNTTPPASGSEDGIVSLTGDATLTVDSAASFGRLSLTGVGTLTLAGEAKITAATIDVGKDVVLNVNADRLDATTFTGSGTVVYTGSAPAAGKGWTDSASWTGTVQVKNVTNLRGTSGGNTYIDFNNCGNANSVIELNGVAGWINPGYTCDVPLKISGTLSLTDGYSNKSNAFKVRKLLGNGVINCSSKADTMVFNVTEDWSGFSGRIELNNKCIVFGETIPDTLTKGTIYVCEGAVVTPQHSSGTWWAVGGIKVDGELRAPNLEKFGGGTNIRTGDNGTFTLTSTGNGSEGETETDYSRIQGTGSLKYEGSGWRALSTNNFPTAMALVNEQAGDILLSRALTYSIGSLRGSKNFQGNYGSGSRYLDILQDRDTEWSGKVANDAYSRLAGFTVNASSTGTLTFSGSASQSVALNIAGGAVKVTGTWKGATTVAGKLAFGGAGKVDGAVSTSAGAVLDYAEATGTSHITGALTLDADTTIKLPAAATFPYKLAGSIAGSVRSLEAAKYTIGGSAGTVPLLLSSDGNAYISATGTFSGDSDWASVAWENGVAPIYGSEVSVTVAASGTLSLGSVGAMKATFVVPADRTLTLTGALLAPEICFTGAGKVVCSEKNTLTGVIKGDQTITIEYPEHKLPMAGTAVWTSDDWKGTLVLKNCGRERNEEYQPGGDIHATVRFDQYGSAYSTIRAPGYKGISAVADQNTTCLATLRINDGETVEFNHGTGESELNTNGAGFRFAKLAGAGTLRLDGTSDTAQYIFDDVREFTGTVEITFPAEGGRKSFLFGAQSGWDVMSSAYAANLVVLGDMAVAAGKTWDVPAGIIIDEGKTLTLGNGATVKALGKDTSGTIAVPAGTSAAPVSATLEGVSNSVVNASLDIGEHATLKIVDPSLSTLTIPADSSAGGTYGNAGMLDLSDCSALEALHLSLGRAKTFSFANVSLPSTCTTIYYDIGEVRDLTGYSLAALPGSATNICYYATETEEEYANGGFIVSNVTAGTVWLIRQNGALIKTAESGTDRTYEGGRSFAGSACWHEWDFEQAADANKLDDSGACTTNNSVVASNKLAAVGGSISYQSVRVGGETKTAITTSVHPSPSEALAFPTATTGWSAALRCSMPTVTGADKAVAIAFGDATSGVVGLAAVAGDFVEMFNWTNGVYTALANLKVEAPSDKDNMHIYVFAVTNGMVTLYRDGEFIHTAQFALDGAITTFMVGDVSGRGGAANLPAAATGGYVDYVRLYDKVMPEADVTGLSLRRPFVSLTDAYERTETLLGHFWSEADAWTLKPGGDGETTTATLPAAGKNVTFTADSQADVSLNLDADVTYGTLIFAGSGDTGLYQASNGWISAQMVVVRKGVNLTVDYDAVNLADSVVGVDQGASLTFNFAGYPFADITAVTTNTLAGMVPARQYDDTCTNRYSVSLPDALPANIASVEAAWDGISYKVVIAPNHTAGDMVYYKDGALAAGMTVYTNPALTEEYETTLFAGDTLVVSAASSTGDLSVDDSFNGNVDVTRAMVNLASTGDNALNGRNVEVSNGCSLGFQGGKFGAVTLVGPGSFAVAEDTTAASLSGTVGISVAAGKTLTLGAVAPFVSGGVSGTGTVKLPAHSGSTGFDFRPYGNGSSTIALSSFSDYLTATSNGDRVNVESTLRLDGAMTITALSSYTYTFAKITGVGNLSFPVGASPAITITELADYGGTLVNNHATATVTVAKLTKTGVYVGGDLLLTKGGDGSVVVSGVEIGGVAKQGVWEGNNFYLAAAEYNSQKYKTVAAAIAAAGDANIGAITVFDGQETLAAQYMYVTVEGVIRVSKKPFAVVKSGVPSYFNNAQDAIISVGMTPGYAYDYIEVLVGGSLDIPLNIFESLKIKNTGGATLNFTGIADDCTTSEDSSSGTYTVYTKSNRPTVYTWTGGAFDSVTGGPDTRWDASGNWRYLDSSSETAVASRQPQSGDFVVFNANATVSIGNDVEVVSVTNSAAVVFTNDSGTKSVTATAGGIVLTDAGASITISGVTLSPTPTTTVADAHVKLDGSTYSVVAANVSIAPVSVAYGADFTNATITATVSGTGYDTATYSLAWGSAAPVAGTRDGTTVTFTVPVSAAPHASVTYTITATVSGMQAGSLEQATTVADSRAWICERAASANGESGSAAGSGGSWATPVTYNDNAAAVSDNTFTADNCSTGDLVTVTVENVVYTELSNTSDVSVIDAASQGAFALAEVAGDPATTNFMILAKENDVFTWKPATCSVAARLGDEYDVVFKFDYAHGTYSVSVNGAALSVNESTTFGLCTAKAEVSALDFKGSGTISSILGEESTGYMAKDSAGHWYATVDDAITGYNRADGPYYILHETDLASLAARGFKVVDGILKKLIRGWMMIAQ